MNTLLSFGIQSGYVNWCGLIHVTEIKYAHTLTHSQSHIIKSYIK